MQQLEGVEHGVEHGGEERVATQASFVVETECGGHLKIANIRKHTNKLHRISQPVMNIKRLHCPQCKVWSAVLYAILLTMRESLVRSRRSNPLLLLLLLLLLLMWLMLSLLLLPSSLTSHSENVHAAGWTSVLTLEP